MVQDGLLRRLAETLGKDPFGPAVRVVTAPAATLHWEREILTGLGGGSLRLRVESPVRLAADILADRGRSAAALSRLQLRCLSRVVASRQGALQAFGDADAGREGAESRLAATLEAAWWQGPRLPEPAARVLGREIFEALARAQDAVQALAAEAGLTPEPCLLWRAVELAGEISWGQASVFWPAGPLRAPEAALRTRLRERGILADLPDASEEVPRARVAVEVRAAQDMRAEARAAARHCLDLVRQGAWPGDILIGCGDFALQQGLLRSALGEAGIAADAGPEPVQGEPLFLCVSGMLDLVRGHASDALLAIAGSGMVPEPGPLRDSILGHLRDGRGLGGDAAAFLARLEKAAAQWPRRASFEEHRACLTSLLAMGELENRLELPELGRQRATWQSLEEQFDAVAAVVGEEPVERPLALRLLGDALQAARPDYQPRRDAVRVVPLGEMHGLEAMHVLLLGLAEGRFPALGSSPGLVQAGQMQRCEALGVPLAEPLPERRQRALLAVAAAIGAAKRSLYASYAEIDADGGVQAAAIRLRRLGEPKEPQPATPERAAAVALTRQEAGELLAEAAARQRDIGGNRTLTDALLAAHARACGSGAHLHGLAEAPQEENLAPLGGPFTVTSLERRAACPFTSFAHDVLRVEPGQRVGFDPAARGALVHQVLRELPPEAPPAGAQPSLVADLVERAAQELGVLSQDTPQGRNLQEELAGEVLRTARLVWEEAKRSSFHPAGREVAFGRRGEWPPLAVTSQDGQEILIEGRIDRLDRLGERLRVVDYKVRRRQSFSFARVFHGLDLQIGAYALAAAQAGGAPVAMTYWPVRLGQNWVADEGDDDPDGVWRQQRPQGLFLADPDLLAALDREAPDGGSPFHPLRRKKGGGLQSSAWVMSGPRWQALLRHVEATLRQLAQEALEGSWAPSPYALGRDTACDNCGLRPACRHVPGRDGYRRLPRATQEVLDNAAADD